MNKPVISIIIKFALSATVFLLAIVRIGMGYVTSSRVVKYGNISAQGSPISFWVTIAMMIMVSGVLFIFGVAGVLKLIKDK